MSAPTCSRIATVLSLAIILVGCAAPGPRYLAVSPNTPPPAAVQTRVALAAGDSARIDRLFIFGHQSEKWSYRTGERFHAVFAAEPATASATLRLKDGLLSNEFVALGFAARVTYTLSSELEVGGQSFQIKVEEHDTGDLENAAQSAVDQAIAATALQVTDILAREAPPSDRKPAIAERLRQLDDLLKAGAISVDEHRTRRAEILKEL